MIVLVLLFGRFLSTDLRRGGDRMSSVAASKTGGRLLGGYFVLLAIFLYAPLAVMIIFAFNDSFVQTFPWSGFTTKWFHNAFSNTELIDSLEAERSGSALRPRSARRCSA